ncbi:hypothetical protein [Ramlibacter sp. AN1133]|uniref:hypothetical protein n=1 Tax=Ramlibacter sp. AN1133 TaxID=3133429 RepID=UPI0030BA7F92
MKTIAQRSATVSAAVLVGLALSSCGGGEPYTGLWEGSVDGNGPVTTIVLGDGTYFMKYPASPGVPGGLVRGTGDFHGATFTSTDGVDYRFAFPPQRPTPATITARVTAKGGNPAVAGTVNAKSLQLAYVKPFDPDGKLADLAGSYPGEVTFSLGIRQTVFEVTQDGKLTTLLNGCAITGQVVPRRDDAFDLTIQFGGAPCVFPGAAFQGAAVYSHELQQLDAAVVNPTFGQAITFIARKNR